MKKNNNFFKYIKQIPFFGLLLLALLYLFGQAVLMGDVFSLYPMFTGGHLNAEFGLIYSSYYIFVGFSVFLLILNLIAIIAAIKVYPKSLWGATAILAALFIVLLILNYV